jgi:3-hydroxy-9,10-secoandrosta-1,3,5(10)-triene-9,17-dione monooxygenase
MENIQERVEGTFTHEEAVAKVKELIPNINSRFGITDKIGKQPQETIDEIIDSGLVRILQPVKFGGHELTLKTAAETIIEIAKADPSAGWCYGLLVMHSWMLAYWPEKAQKEIWNANPDACIASSFNAAPASKVEKVEGGYQISGEWGFSSGIDHSEWVMVGSIQFPENRRPQFLMLIINEKDFEIKDTWQVQAQKGTGSKTIVVKETFVPDYRVVDMVAWSKSEEMEGSKVNTGPLYNLPLYAAMQIGIASAVLGASKGAFEVWKESIRNKLTVSHSNVKDYTHQQIRLAEVSAALEAAEALFYKTIEALRDGGPIEILERTKLRRNYAYMVRLCNETVRKIVDHAGAAIIFDHNPIQRYWRDVQAGSMHIAFNMDSIGETLGKLELGIGLNPKDNLLS